MCFVALCVIKAIRDLVGIIPRGESCESARYVHHPPQVQLDVFFIFFREVNVRRLTYEKCACLVKRFQDASFTAGDGVYINLYKGDRISISPMVERGNEEDKFVPGAHSTEHVCQDVLPAS